MGRLRQRSGGREGVGYRELRAASSLLRLTSLHLFLLQGLCCLGRLAPQFCLLTLQLELGSSPSVAFPPPSPLYRWPLASPPTPPPMLSHPPALVLGRALGGRHCWLPSQQPLPLPPAHATRSLFGLLRQSAPLTPGVNPVGAWRPLR